MFADCVPDIRPFALVTWVTEISRSRSYGKFSDRTPRVRGAFLMDVSTATVATRSGSATGIRPARGLMYSVLFGLATWGLLLGAVGLGKALIG